MEEIQKYLDRALHFLRYRPRTEKEIINYLSKKKADDKTSQLVVEKLKDLQLINDHEFAKWWIEQRQTFRPRGMHIIKMELKQKGVAEDIIQEVTQESSKNV